MALGSSLWFTPTNYWLLTTAMGSCPHGHIDLADCSDSCISLMSTCYCTFLSPPLLINSLLFADRRPLNLSTTFAEPLLGFNLS